MFFSIAHKLTLSSTFFSIRCELFVHGWNFPCGANTFLTAVHNSCVQEKHNAMCCVFPAAKQRKKHVQQNATNSARKVCTGCHVISGGLRTVGHRSRQTSFPCSSCAWLFFPLHTMCVEEGEKLKRTLKRELINFPNRRSTLSFRPTTTRTSSQ